MRRDLPGLAAALLALLAFLAFGAVRDTFVGGSDSYGYYSLALLFEEGRMTLPVGLDPERFPAVAPLGYVADGSRVVPTYSPGLPFLMRLARPLGLEFFVAPFFGALSTLLAFALLRRFVRPWTALAFAAVWTASPIVVWGGRSVMSDMPSACAALGVLLLHERRRWAWTGVLVGLSLALRPSNALMFALVAGALALRPGRLVRFGLGFAAGVVPIAVYDAIQFGSPLRTGYGEVGSGFTTGVFFHHAAFYATNTLVQLSPLVLLALVPVVARPRKHAWLAAWFLSFFLFYSCYWPGADAWWYARFLLPAYPALLVLAAVGSEDVRRWLGERLPSRRGALAGGAALLAALAVAGLLVLGERQGAFLRSDGDQARASVVVREAVPADAVVGAIDLSGSMRLYGGLETFRWDDATAIALVDFLLSEGRPVFVVVAPWNQGHERLVELRERFTLEPFATLEPWHHAPLLRVTP